MEPELTLTLSNIGKLRDHWLTRRDSIKIDMSLYGSIDSASLEDIKLGETNHCGTSCCILGIAPEIFPANKSHFLFGYFSYHLFGLEYFPCLYTRNVFTIERNAIWNYLFSPYWSNDLDHALSRMDDVIGGKITPEFTDDDFRKAITRALGDAITRALGDVVIF